VGGFSAMAWGLSIPAARRATAGSPIASGRRFATCGAPPLGAVRARRRTFATRKPNRVSDGDLRCPAAWGCPCPSPDVPHQEAQSRKRWGSAVPRRSGLPVPVAGRSPRPSRPRLSACPLRFGILPALAPIARLPGTGSPSLLVRWCAGALVQPDPCGVHGNAIRVRGGRDGPRGHDLPIRSRRQPSRRCGSGRPPRGSSRRSCRRPLGRCGRWT